MSGDDGRGADDVWTRDERAILQQRTSALARRPVDTVTTVLPAIYFRVGRQRCCALARSVRAAIRLDGMAPIPRAGRTVAGAILRGGVTIPVFHLAGLVSERIGRLPETAHGLLLGEHHDEVALAVDAIDGFGDLDPTALGAPSDEIQSPWITGTTPSGESFVDLDALRDGPLLWVDAARD